MGIGAGGQEEFLEGDMIGTAGLNKIMDIFPLRLLRPLICSCCESPRTNDPISLYQGALYTTLNLF